MTGAAELHVAGLSKSFGAAPVLRGIDLTVAPGRLVAILGASGSGKTTLLRLLCGFERADAGRITLGGQLVSAPGVHRPPEQRRVGYVAQEGALFPHLTVAENVLFGLPRSQRRDNARAAALLEQVGLPASYVGRGPHQLSGGEQQRVALARALAPAPSLVLLDEPFSALDAALRVDTRLAVAASLAAAGATAILVTHDQAEALSLGDEVAVLRRGALVQVAAPAELYQRPVDAELARFVGEAVLLPGVAGDGAVECCLGRLASDGAQPGAVTVLIRPEQIVLMPEPGAAPGCSASVLAVRFNGPDATVQLRLADGQAVVARVPGYAAPAVGCAVGLSVSGRVMTYPADPGPGR